MKIFRIEKQAAIAAIANLAIILLFLSPNIALAQVTLTPKAAVEKTIENMRTYVSGDGKTQTREELDIQLESRARPIFDFAEMSKQCLGPRWNEINKGQQVEFIELFSKLLSRTYISKIRDGIEGSKIAYIGEKIQGNKSIVKSTVETEEQKAKIDYRLHLSSGSWKVYDIVIENIGLVSNYRSDFGGIIRDKGMDGLIKQLREKVAQAPQVY